MRSFIDGDSAGKIAKATGEVSRTIADATSEPGDAEAYADEFRAAFEAHAGTMKLYLSDRFDAEETAIAIRFSDRRGGRAERYAIASANVSSGDFEELMVVGPERFESLERTVDRRVALDWHLSRNAADELRTFVEEFAARDRDPTSAYVAKTAAKYGDSVDDDLFDSVVARFE